MGDGTRRGPRAVAALRALVRAIRRQDIHVRRRRTELHRDERDLGVRHIHQGLGERHRAQRLPQQDYLRPAQGNANKFEEL